MKNKKLKLEDLKVQSFVTSLTNPEKQTLEEVLGGVSRVGSGCITCDWQAPACPIDSNNPMFCSKHPGDCPDQELNSPQTPAY